MSSNLFFNILFWGPIIVWTVVYFIKPKLAVSWTDKFSLWVENKRKILARKRNFTSKYFFRPLFWTLSKLMSWTERRFKNEYSRSAARAILSSYIFLFFTFAAMLPLFWSIYLVIILAVLFPLAALVIFLFYLSKKRSARKERVVLESIKDDRDKETAKK